MMKNTYLYVSFHRRNLLGAALISSVSTLLLSLLFLYVVWVGIDAILDILLIFLFLPILLFISGTFSSMYIQKLSSSRPALRITEQGIEDNLSIVSAGPLQWSEIREIRIIPAAHGSFHLVIKVKDFSLYMLPVKNIIKKSIAQSHISKYRSPIVISSRFLVTDIEELEQFLQNQKQKIETIEREKEQSMHLLLMGV